VIGGGVGNIINTNAMHSVIIGGISNIIGDGSAAVTNSVVLGGSNNNALASFSIVSGNRATSTNRGAVVFADSQEADFFSTSNNQFNVRAAGGFRLIGDQTLSGSVTATNNVIANNYFYSTNFARIKRQMSCREVVGTENWTFAPYNTESYNHDSILHTANAMTRLSWHVPSYATNMVITYYAAADSARAWTNKWRQFIYDTGARDFGAVLSDYAVVVPSTVPVYQSNSVPIAAGKTNSMMVLDFYSVGTNTANNYYFMGPISVLFEP
jgi:hypothetical protein